MLCWGWKWFNRIFKKILKRRKNILEQKYLNYIEQFEPIKENFENLNLLKHNIKKYIYYINKLILDINYEEVLKYINKLNNTNIFRKNLIIVKTDINILYDLNISSVDWFFS